MKGLELAKKYYETYGKPMLEEKFSQYLDKIAVGLVGHGSECFGFDDEISQDHDYEAGFCLWVDDETYQEIGFKLFRAYLDLPHEFMEISLQNQSLKESNNLGVHKISEFYSYYLPNGKLPTTNEEWLLIDDKYLAEATNGEVFFDEQYKFTEIRNHLLYNRPEDVRLKKLASNLFYMAQYGQYNYARCAKHQEPLACATILSKFVEHTAFVIYLLNNKYAPYYKWLYKGLRTLPILGNIYFSLELLMKNPLDVKNNIKIIEDISTSIEEELRKQNLCIEQSSYLESYAYSVLNKIKDNNLRNSDVMM